MVCDRALPTGSHQLSSGYVPTKDLRHNKKIYLGTEVQRLKNFEGLRGLNQPPYRSLCPGTFTSATSE